MRYLRRIYVTKNATDLSDKNHFERLKRLKLTKLQERPIWGDFIQYFKIGNGFRQRETFKIETENFSNCKQSFHFLTNWIATNWNSLTIERLNSKQLQSKTGQAYVQSILQKSKQINFKQFLRQGPSKWDLYINFIQCSSQELRRRYTTTEIGLSSQNSQQATDM